MDDVVINGKKYIILEEVLKRVGLKQAKLYEMLRYDRFPQPFKPISRAYWLESDIDNFIKEKTQKELSNE